MPDATIQGYKVTSTTTPGDPCALTLSVTGGPASCGPIAPGTNPFFCPATESSTFTVAATPAAPSGYVISTADCQLTDCGNPASYVVGSSLQVQTPSSTASYPAKDIRFMCNQLVSVAGFKVNAALAAFDPGSTLTMTANHGYPSASVGNSGTSAFSASVAGNVSYTITSSQPPGYTVFHADCDVSNCALGSSFTPGLSFVVTTPASGAKNIRFMYSQNPPNATITAPPFVPPGATGVTASVPAQSGASYSWSISNGTITGSTTGPSITFTSGTDGTLSLSCTVSVLGITVAGSAAVSVGCPAEQKSCNGLCIAETACCTDSDCPALLNATTRCAAGACNPTCTSPFVQCGNSCISAAACCK